MTSAHNPLHGFYRPSVCHAAVRIHPAGVFSLYGIRHIAELLSLDIYKQACISNTINSYCMADC